MVKNGRKCPKSKSPNPPIKNLSSLQIWAFKWQWKSKMGNCFCHLFEWVIILVVLWVVGVNLCKNLCYARALWAFALLSSDNKLISTRIQIYKVHHQEKTLLMVQMFMAVHILPQNHSVYPKKHNLFGVKKSRHSGPCLRPVDCNVRYLLKNIKNIH